MTDREKCYLHDSDTVAAEVWEWAKEAGRNPLMLIAYCGYAEEGFELPEGWWSYHWKANGGMANQGDEEGRGRQNARREVIYFSPATKRGVKSVNQVLEFD